MSEFFWKLNSYSVQFFVIKITNVPISFQASATHALERTDQTEVDGKIITVAISNPPERKNTASLLSDRGEPLANFALGGGSADKADFGSLVQIWVKIKYL